MQDDHRHGRVEDYTSAFLCTLGLVVFMLLWAIAALAGALAMLLAAAVFDVVGRWWARRLRG